MNSKLIVALKMTQTMKCAVVVVSMLLVLQPAMSRILTKCQAAQELYKNGIAKADLPNWLCLIQSESSYNTAAKHTNTNKSTDYGLFQINNAYWCKDNTVGGDCHLKCSSLVNDDITDDIKCAKLIYSRMGYNAWYGWINKCKGKPLPSIAGCF